MTRDAGPLGHLSVVDVTHHVAGPYCTKLLAGFGARVIKIERPPAGDPLRAAAPGGLPFAWLNTGKESVAIDLATPAGRELLDELLSTADALVDNLSPDAAERLGLGEARIGADHPHLVRAAIRNFGESGPRRDWQATEAVAYAMSGGMAATGDPARAPLQSGPSIAQYTAGMHAYIGILMALYRRGDSGVGERVEVSVQESALDNVEIHLAEHLHAGKTAKRNDDAHAMVPWQCHPCRDGHAAVIGGPIRRWLPALDLFDEPRLSEPRFRDMGGRIKHRGEFEPLLRPWLERTDGRDVFREGQRRGLAFGYLRRMDEVAACEQHAARDYFEAVAQRDGSSLRMPRAPFGGEAARSANRRAPSLGEHTRAVLGDVLGRSEAEIARLVADGVVVGEAS